MWEAARLILQIVSISLGWRGDVGTTSDTMSSGSSPAQPRPCDSATQEASRTGSRKQGRQPVSAVLVMAGLSRATIPVPYWVVARAVEREPIDVLVALVELEATGVVVSRAYAGGGVLYAMAGEKRWREMWSS